MVTAQKIRLNNFIAADGGHHKQEPLTSELTAQKIFRLCNMFAKRHPKSRVIVIIQGPNCPKDVEVEQATTGVCSKKEDELDLVLSSLGQDNTDADNGPDTEPDTIENNSVSFNYIGSIREDEYIERKEQPITNREAEILRHIACGETNKRIAYFIGISEQTVKCHVSSILRKLRANDRAHSVALALRKGFI